MTDSAARQGPTFQRALVAGALSGLAVDLMFFPLDTIKTRVQSSKGFWASGGFRGVYRGVGSVGAGSAPGAAAFFVTYEALKRELATVGLSLNTHPGLNHMLSASGGEFVSCLIRVPTEVVKSRTQTSAYGSTGGSWHTALNTMRYEGIRGFYRGFGITIAREIPFTSIQFPFYEYLKRTLSTTYLEGKRPNSAEAAVCGMIAGGTAAALTTPLDVVKTRVMLEARGAPGEKVASPSILSFPPRFLGILKKEGPAALFSGWVPRTLHISAGGAVFLGIYDFVVNFGRPDGAAVGGDELK